MRPKAIRRPAAAEELGPCGGADLESPVPAQHPLCGAICYLHRCFLCPHACGVVHEWLHAPERGRGAPLHRPTAGCRSLAVGGGREPACCLPPAACRLPPTAYRLPPTAYRLQIGACKGIPPRMDRRPLLSFSPLPLSPFTSPH